MVFLLHALQCAYTRVYSEHKCAKTIWIHFFFYLNAGIRHLPLFLSIMGGGDLSHGRVLAFDWSGQAEK